jgi:DNA-binding transcriptional MerR regulator
MGWDKNGRYYTRSKRVNGRVVREYVGGGTVGELAARLDALEREERAAARRCARADTERLAELDAPLLELNELADLLARAALLAAGYVRHNRGEWRKKRA